MSVDAIRRKQQSPDMFDPPFVTEISWGEELARAAQQGPAEVVRVVRRRSVDLDEETRDEYGVQLTDLLSMRLDPPGLVGSLTAALNVLTGPQTVAAIGRALREDDGSDWKIERGFEALRFGPGPECSVQLMLCAHDAASLQVLVAARSAVRGEPRLVAELFDVLERDVPVADLERFLELTLEQAMIHGTRFTFQQLRAAMRSPAAHVMRRVIWGRYDGRRPIEVFFADPEGVDFFDDEWNEVELPDDASIGVVHPAEYPTQQRRNWGEVFAENEIVALFPQFDRPCPAPGFIFPYGELDAVADHWTLTTFLARHGWWRGERQPDYILPIRGAELVLWTKLQDNELDRWLTNLYLRFGPGGELEDRIVIGEAMVASQIVLERFAPEFVVHG